MFYDITGLMAQTKIKNHRSNSALRIKMRVKQDLNKKKRERVK